MNILNLIETLKFGGAEILIENNLSWLKTHTDWNLEVAVLFEPGEVADRLKGKGIKVHFLKLSNRFNFIEAVFKIGKLLNDNNYDILHTHLFHANIYGRLGVKFSRKKMPMVVTSFHNPDYSFEDNKRFTFRVRKSIDYWTYRRVNFTGVAVSEAVADDYKKHFRLEDVKVIYNSYLPLWESDNNRDSKTRKKTALGFDEGTNICVTVARFSYQKAYDIYIEAIKEIINKISKIAFIFIGNGPELGRIKNLASKYNLLSYIHFLGAISPEEVRDYVSISDLFVLPSRYEAFGISALEAMVAETPVIATNTGGLKELIRNGTTGLLVEPENHKELADKIIWAIENRHSIEEMAKNAYLHAGAYFSIEHIGYLWKEFYESKLSLYRNTTHH